MSPAFPVHPLPEDRFAPILYGCLEAVGSTKGAFYLREADGSFRCLTQYGWPRGFSPPAIIPPEHPLLLLVKRARRSFAANNLEDFPELMAFGEGSDAPRLFLSPVYLMGDWVGLLVQRDKQRHEPFDEEADSAATLKVCNALAAELKVFRTPEPEPQPHPLVLAGLPPELEPPKEEPRPMRISHTVPMPLQTAQKPGAAEVGSAKATGEVLSGYRAGLEAVAWEGESRMLPGIGEPTPRVSPTSRRQGMFLPEQRAYYWEMAGLMAKLVPCAALAFWMEEVDEVRPILCYSPKPLSDGLKQQILAHVTFNLPLVREQDLRLLTWSSDDASKPIEGGFSTQASLPLGRGSDDLLMVFRLEYAPIEERDLKNLAPALRLLRQFLDESRIHEHYHQSFLSFAHRILSSAEGRVPGLSSHSLACAQWLQALATHLDLPSSEAEALSIAGILHDVGGLMADPAIKQKEVLGEEDWKQIKAHPAQASLFLKDLEFPFDVMAIITSHHERWDGTGYPAGQSGESIPLGARILALVDAFVAMTQGRAHKPPVPVEAALAELAAGSGGQFDPSLATTFIQLVAQRELSGPLPAVRS